MAHCRSLAQETDGDEDCLRFLEGVLTAELQSREIRRYQRNLRAARFPMVKPKARVDELTSCRFVAAHESVILVGNPGTGKTHVLIGLGMEAIRKGFRVRFVTAGALVNELLPARAELRVPKLLRFYGIFDLVLVDELGYVPFSREAAQLLFQFFSDRYETKATALADALKVEGTVLQGRLQRGGQAPHPHLFGQAQHADQLAIGSRAGRQEPVPVAGDGRLAAGDHGRVGHGPGLVLQDRQVVLELERAAARFLSFVYGQLAVSLKAKKGNISSTSSRQTTAWPMSASAIDPIGNSNGT